MLEFARKAPDRPRARVFRLSAACALLAAASGCAGPVDLSDRARLEEVSARLDTFEIEVESRGGLLWQGVARVNRMTAGHIRVNASEAAGPSCRPLGPGRSNSYELDLLVSKYGGNLADPDTYRFAATLDRMDLAADCEGTTRSSVNAGRTMRMRRGQRVELTGRDGLLVTIRRI